MSQPQPHRQEIKELVKQLKRTEVEKQELNDVLEAWGERAQELIAGKPTVWDMTFFIVSMGEWLR